MVNLVQNKESTTNRLRNTSLEYVKILRCSQKQDCGKKSEMMQENGDLR